VAEGRDFADLRETGLLWLINRVVFHPRGFGLALHVADDGTTTGWSLQGDGSEPWTFEDGPEQADMFRRAERTLAPVDGKVLRAE
jgi:hypothetical protein